MNVKLAPSPEGRSTRRFRESVANRGFALVVTLSLMVLLVVIAVGLLSLATINLRRTSSESASITARSNARLAVMLAMGELQKSLGDDRRVTADASIFDNAANPHALGVWKSWSPKLAENPLGAPPRYATEKENRFVSWLTSSGNPTELASLDWAKSGATGDAVELFAEDNDGFNLAGATVKVPGSSSGTRGSFAWAVVQDATKAKINVGGPETGSSHDTNDELQAQARPNLTNSDNFKQPAEGWDKRMARVVSIGQAKLDPDLYKGTGNIKEKGDFTANGFGLLTDVVNGGFKTDMSLGFEMSDSSFRTDSWNGFKNPFRAKPTTPSSYAGQGALFRPMTTSGSVQVQLNFSPASATFEFPAAAVPTFDTIRSYYRTPFHLYSTSDGATAFERPGDHVALRAPGGGIIPPGAPPPARNSQTGYRPVLDRVLFVLSMGMGSDNEVRMVVTPIVTLWNPYNTALEIEGAVAYPWMDLPFRLEWTFTNSLGAQDKQNVSFSQVVNSQFAHLDHGRSVNPYFYAMVTPNGGPAAGGQSIRFQPGEVRVFVPADGSNTDFSAGSTMASKAIYLRPVDSIDQYNFKGGLSIPMKNAINSKFGFTRPVAPTDSVEVSVVPDSNSDYPLSVGLEDVTRAKSPASGDNNRGLAVCDVQTVNYAQTGVTTTMKSPRMTYGDLTAAAAEKMPFGVIETYHRVARDSAGNRRSDLVYTTNPRQAFVNRYITNGTFASAPHYETVVRSVSKFDQVIESGNGGRNAFYGESNTASGRTHLSFFEIPEATPLSIAALQNADLSWTAYSPANQIGNSWASAYVKRNAPAEKIAKLKNQGQGVARYDRNDDLPVYDYSYLLNESLFDSYYFSGISTEVAPGGGGGSPDVWDSTVANVRRSHEQVLKDHLGDPEQNPLRNSRMRFFTDGKKPSEIESELLEPEGCLKIAEYLQVDGAFNVNSTSEKAWMALLSGLRDRDFKVVNGTPPAAGKSAFPRFRMPVGTDSDNWLGYRSLSEDEIRNLAGKMVQQVKLRGPFLSLGEFVNRRVEGSDEMGIKGALQTAIDECGVNGGAMYDTFSTTGYPASSKRNIDLPNTGVGIPGYLTQADVLQSIAPVLSARSDTFTIRGYGEARDASGKVTANAWCEAVVQRTPDFIDATDAAYTQISALKPVNQLFGRRFEIISFRFLSRSEEPA